MRTVLFFLNFVRFFGSNLKLWDYFNHVLKSPNHTAYARFSSASVWDASNPWTESREHVVHDADQVAPDILFLSGTDWLEIAPGDRDNSPIPIINLIQSLWHACPNDHLDRHSFLSHKAIRICVSPQVTKAIAATGQARGPLLTIPAGVDYRGLIDEGDSRERDTDLLIVANKDQALGRRLLTRLHREGRTAHIIDRHVPRTELLEWLRRSRVSLFVPRRKEGFYLPALEGMALGTIVVCPDCIGNRSFCVPGVNCLRPDYTEEELVEAAESALADPEALRGIVEKASLTAQEHDLNAERGAFLEILRSADELWQSI